ncbi:MAG TPA: antitoxin Xre/MbcA/ParS toxin-binding domain-containing protein [Rhodopila sp.]|uniref:antitoxin Xre/MbcA/ParS toxin-binding domain-containing protein n=1 Tax=Rhodopila sp. TaxID=2480087 RepID=UPI002B8AC4FF|nr:antitoxin Xre/MbcA/ParS toxin-binding domain-containing protein [Rhodopila sp.]HVY14880.1 antitoxin Xre/MbcA/ParS toxin-binding domain-containing protein [Rhodopila sp.]
MLTDYDAKAIADIMGLAFLRGHVTARGGHHDPVIRDDDGASVVVKVKPARGAGVVPSPSPVFIARAVEQGLPRAALRHVAESIAGDDKVRISALEWGIVPKTTLDRRTNLLSLQESERTERAARLFVHACRALGSIDEARAFMTTPHPELDGRSPMDAVKTDLGTRRVEQLLTALEYGLAL